MADRIYKKRAIFRKGEQARFLVVQLRKIGISWSELAEKIDIHKRTLSDWSREQYSIPIDKLEKICKLSGSEMPKNIKLKDPFWYTFKGAKLGAIATLNKYGRVGGDQAYQKMKWYEWWNKKGKHRKVGCIIKPLPINTPNFSKDLAEFTGIMIGDGGITQGQITVSTNSVDDKQYGFFVKRLIEKLFKVNASIYYVEGVRIMSIVVSRKKLVEFCHKKLGLCIGNKLKQGLDIPSWIRKNPEYERRCVRGIMDTDGCIFNECHNIKGKKYSYKKLCIVSASPPLRKSIFEILEKNGLTPKLKGDRCVQIEARENIEKYFKIIGTSNPKHLKRYNK
jgi:transcriptional regulator with XRE-family HTH domain